MGNVLSGTAVTGKSEPLLEASRLEAALAKTGLSTEEARRAARARFTWNEQRTALLVDEDVLIDALEEESEDDTDYYIDAATIDVIADGRASDHLVHLLRTALGTSEGVDIRWTRR